MDNLPNERYAIREKLESFNMQPVLAEDFRGGGTVWQMIQHQIRSCHLFVIVLGDEYGSPPDDDPRSVTEREYDEARRLGLPISVFIKELSKGDATSGVDAERREAFAVRLSDWESGHWVTSFRMAHDLAQKVGESVMQQLSVSFPEVQARAADANAAIESLGGGARPAPPPEPTLPHHLVTEVAKRRALLVGGAGMSLAAGLYSATAFAERLAQVVRADEPGYGVSAAGSAVAGVNSDLEAHLGRDRLEAELTQLVVPPHGSGPTPGHAAALRLFDRVVTTNFDTLFEQAALEEQTGHEVIARELDAAELPRKVVVKAHGSHDVAGSIVATETDLAQLDRARPRLWRALTELLSTHTPIVVGSSLRDPSIVRLLVGATDRQPGYYVGPYLGEIQPKRIQRLGFDVVDADADGFFKVLERSVGSP